MVIFKFKIDERVKEAGTNKIGTVTYMSTTPDGNVPFCRVKFDDGTTKDVAEDKLSRV